MESAIVLPGILARCREQHEPLWFENAWFEVTYLDYNPREFNGFVEAQRAAEVVASELKRTGSSVKMLGTSIGGDLAPFVAAELIKSGVDVSKLRLVLVDAPVGIESFAEMPGWLKKPEMITSNFGAMLGTAIGGGSMVANKFGVGLPKDDYITEPQDDEVMRRMTGGELLYGDDWRKFVKSEAKRGLSGHCPNVWAHEIQWMTKVFHDGLLDEAIRTTVEAGVDVQYVECTDGNTTINHPFAKNWWAERTGEGNLHTVAAPHCGYLQMRDQFAKVLLPLMQW